MEFQDPFELNRRLLRVATSWRSWRRALRSGQLSPLATFELERPCLGQSCFTRLSEDSSGFNPLREPLMRWVYRLAEQRINQAVLLERERLLRLNPIQFPQEKIEVNLAEFRKGLIMPRSGAQQRLGVREEMLRSLGRASSDLSAINELLWQRRLEIGKRMGLNSPSELELPCPEAPSLAKSWLELSEPLYASLNIKTLSQWIEAALDLRSDHGWPAKLSPSSLKGLIQQGDFLRGISLDPGPLPEALGGASFLRALARLGAAWHDAAASSSQPFVIAHEPYGLRRRAVGARTALLALNAGFLRRTLGLSGPRLSAQLRASAISCLLHSRLAALKLLLREPALRGHKFHEVFEELSFQCFGFPISRALRGGLFQLHTDDAQRFLGLYGAASSGAALQAEHDEDWFRNPRGIDAQRAEAEASPDWRFDPAHAETASAELLSSFERCL